MLFTTEGGSCSRPELEPGRSNDAMLIDAEVAPAYFEGPPNLELQFPVSLSYNITGNSRVVSTLNHGTGSYTVSIVATHRET